MAFRQALRDFANRIDDTAVINPETDRRARKLVRCRTGGSSALALGGRAFRTKQALPAGGTDMYQLSLQRHRRSRIPSKQCKNEEMIL
jgi:hypothetical protein